MVVQHAPPSLMQKLERFYVVERPSEARVFLDAEPDVVPVLLDAIEPLKALFGDSANCAVEVEYDLEDDDPLPHLYVTIRSPRGNDEVEQALETFDETWWWDHARGTCDRLTFDVRLA